MYEYCIRDCHTYPWIFWRWGLGLLTRVVLAVLRNTDCSSGKDKE